MNDLLKKLLILRTPGIGPVKYNALKTKYGDLDAIIDSLNLTDEFIDSVRREIDTAQCLGIEYIFETDSLYPHELLDVKNHPIVMCARGNLATLNKPRAAIVGTRHASATGMNFVAEIANNLANHNYAIVSGMAMGTDTAAHFGALKSNGDSQTIAVLAGGVDYIWPLENESLYNEILERGVVLSEMPVGFTPNATNFVQRNRWVAGMSKLLVISEADMKSGSMTTARFAKDYARPVFAVPGHPSDPRSMGPNSLIQSGAATLCISANQFFDKEKSVNEKKSLPQNEILDRIGMIPVSESVLANLVKKSVAEIKSDLVVLELQGFIRKQDGGYVLN